MKNLSFKKLEEVCEKIQFPEIQSLGNGLYKFIPENIICGENFLEKVKTVILDYIKEYNIDTSALANQKYDIVRSANITKEIAEIQG